ncbi:MAG: hypothetical protein IJ368_03535 [Oscillospiraceae bacterium]|nr:hypothetical protein [Oscillospiraceae bacterium]
MKTYICKFIFGERKQSCRILAHSFDSASKTAEKIISSIGGNIVSLTECTTLSVRP